VSCVSCTHLRKQDLENFAKLRRWKEPILLVWKVWKVLTLPSPPLLSLPPPLLSPPLPFFPFPPLLSLPPPLFSLPLHYFPLPFPNPARGSVEFGANSADVNVDVTRDMTFRWWMWWWMLMLMMLLCSMSASVPAWRSDDDAADCYWCRWLGVGGDGGGCREGGGRVGLSDSEI